MNIYIAQLNFHIDIPKLTEEFLLSLFQQYGKVEYIAIAIHRYKSYAYVSMPNDTEAINAIENLNLQYIAERKTKIVVKEANNSNFPSISVLKGKNYQYILI